MLRRPLLLPVFCAVALAGCHNPNGKAPDSTDPTVDPDEGLPATTQDLPDDLTAHALPGWFLVELPPTDQVSCATLNRPQDGYGATPFADDPVLELASYCWLHGPDGASLDRANTFVQQHAPGATVDLDLAVVHPMAVEPEALLTDDHTRSKIGTGVISWDAKATFADPVVLFLHDTYEDPDYSLALPRGQAHGRSLAGVIRAEVCPAEEDPTDPRCRVRLEPKRVLGGMTDEDEDGVEQGYAQGSFGQLALGLVGASRANQGGASVHNLSLAWHPRFGGALPAGANTLDAAKSFESTAWLDNADPSRWNLGAKIVWLAMAEAWCRGDLIVAAAGNHTAGPLARTGPLLPAAWQALPAHEHLDCALSLDDASAETPTRPLVHAVGAVNALADHRPDLGLSRPSSRPPLVAHGHRVFDRDLIADTASATEIVEAGRGPLTGTSAATAVASSTLALAWQGLRLSLGADTPIEEVLDQLPSLSDTLDPALSPVAPTFDPTGTAPTVRVLSPCTTLDELTAGGTSALDVLDGIGCATTDPAPDFPTFAEPQTLAWDAPVTYAPCAADEVYLPTGTAPAFPCAAEQAYGPLLDGGTTPQPVNDQCPTCLLKKSNGAFYLDLAHPTLLTDVSLVTFDGTAYTSFYLGDTVASDPWTDRLPTPPTDAVAARLVGRSATNGRVLQAEVTLVP